MYEYDSAQYETYIYIFILLHESNGDLMIDARILSFVAPDGIKLYVGADKCLYDNHTIQLVDSLRSDFSKQKYEIQKYFGVVEEYK